MTTLKVGDEVVVRATGADGVVVEVLPDGDYRVEFPLTVGSTSRVRYDFGAPTELYSADQLEPRWQG